MIRADCDVTLSRGRAGWLGDQISRDDMSRSFAEDHTRIRIPVSFSRGGPVAVPGADTQCDLQNIQAEASPRTPVRIA